MKIYKFDLGALSNLLHNPNTVLLDLPVSGFQILDAQLMGEDANVFIWVLADFATPGETNPYETVVFEAFGTGWDIPEEYAEGHIKTFLVPNELTTYVWHLFGKKQ